MYQPPRRRLPYQLPAPDRRSPRSPAIDPKNRLRQKDRTKEALFLNYYSFPSSTSGTAPRKRDAASILQVTQERATRDTQAESASGIQDSWLFWDLACCFFLFLDQYEIYFWLSAFWQSYRSDCNKPPPPSLTLCRLEIHDHVVRTWTR